MAGGFRVPQVLIDREASGLDLIMSERLWRGLPIDRPIMMAHRQLAEWIMTDPAWLIPAIEAIGIDVGGVLAGIASVSPAAALALYDLTGGAIRLADWTRPYSAGPVSPHEQGLSEAAGAAEPSVPAADSIPIIHGRLGETPPGRLFRVIRGAPDRPYVLTGMGVAWALEESAARAACAALAAALGLELSDRGSSPS